MKRLVWLGDSLERLRLFPDRVKDEIGHALYVAQVGDTHLSAKPLHGLGGGVMEIVSRDRSGTFRAVYTVSIGEFIYVIHAFQKKSKAGSTTPRSEMDVVKRRLRRLREDVRNG